ncbi:MAG TPA: hypothetical protein VGF16_18535 [Bryobacteraceae bacterium]
MNWDLILNEYLAWSIAAIAFFSFLAVASWAHARRKEREAFYRSEAVRKIAEMPTAPPEPVLQLLRQAVAPPPQSAASMGAIQAKAYFRAETMKRIAEMQGAGAESLLALMREEEQAATRRQRIGMRLAGMICLVVGVGLAAMLVALVPSPPNPPVYVAGIIPALVGAVLLGFSYTVGTKEEG